MNYDDFVDSAVIETEKRRVDSTLPGFQGAHSPMLRWVFSQRETTRMGESSYLDAPVVQRRGLWCEFGVHTGGSLKQMVAARGFPSPPNCIEIAARVVGFDSFEGLPEDWRPDYPRGRFSEQGRVPQVDGAEIVPGLFRDTLPRFDDRGADLTFVHVDCDLYSSAREVLDWAEPRLRSGSVVVFDELVGYPEFREHELKALYESWKRGLTWDWLGTVNAAVAIRIRY